jgi:hypothetical protein
MVAKHYWTAPGDDYLPILAVGDVARHATPRDTYPAVSVGTQKEMLAIFRRSPVRESGSGDISACQWTRSRRTL